MGIIKCTYKATKNTIIVYGVVLATQVITPIDNVIRDHAPTIAVLRDDTMYMFNHCFEAAFNYRGEEGKNFENLRDSYSKYHTRSILKQHAHDMKKKLEELIKNP